MKQITRIFFLKQKNKEIPTIKTNERTNEQTNNNTNKTHT